MKPYEELTVRGKTQRLYAVAQNAIQAYDLPVQGLRFLCRHTNTMFRIDGEDGRKFVLRICAPASSSLQENLAEVSWLDALARDTDLNIPEPQPLIQPHPTGGSYINFVSAPGAPGEWRCILYSWIPGRPLALKPTPPRYWQLGRAMAALHRHAAGFSLPAEIQPKRWDRVFYFPGESAVYHTPPFARLFTDQQIDILDRVVEQADKLLGGLYASGEAPRLMHCDLHEENVHIYRQKLYVLDFEDVILGYPLQDVAVALFYIRLWEPEISPLLMEAFQAGYESLEPWPIRAQAELELFWAARTAMFINYVTSQKDVFENAEQKQAFYQRAFGRLEDYLSRWG